MAAPVGSVMVDSIETNPCTRNCQPLLLPDIDIPTPLNDDVVVVVVVPWLISCTITSSKISVKCGVSISNNGQTESTLLVSLLLLPFSCC